MYSNSGGVTLLQNAPNVHQMHPIENNLYVAMPLGFAYRIMPLKRV